MISNLEYYRDFLYVANLRSFTKAADLLCVSQPAVSQAIKKLEQELGCPLFLRAGRELGLTPEGEELFLHVSKAIAELQTGENTLQRMSEGQSGTLSIGATETTIRFYLAPKIRSFQQLHPDIHITFQGATTDELVKLLHGGEIEAAFLITPFETPAGVQLQKLHDFRDIAVASADYPLDFSASWDPARLQEYPLICVSSKNQVRQNYDQWFLECGVVLSPSYTVQSMGLVLPLVRSGLGIGLLPEEYVQNELAGGTVRQLQIKGSPPVRTLSLAYEKKRISTAADAFISFILADAGDGAV